MNAVAQRPRHRRASGAPASGTARRCESSEPRSGNCPENFSSNGAVFSSPRVARAGRRGSAWGVRNSRIKTTQRPGGARTPGVAARGKWWRWRSMDLAAPAAPKAFSVSGVGNCPANPREGCRAFAAPEDCGDRDARNQTDDGTSHQSHCEMHDRFDQLIQTAVFIGPLRRRWRRGRPTDPAAHDGTEQRQCEGDPAPGHAEPRAGRFFRRWILWNWITHFREILSTGECGGEARVRKTIGND